MAHRSDDIIKIRILRRLGETPQALRVSATGQSCPDVLETENGDCAVIGAHDPLSGMGSWPTGTSAVIVPRVTLLSAATSLARRTDITDIEGFRSSRDVDSSTNA